jgi:hypothetical protein
MRPLNWYLKRRARGSESEADLEEWWLVFEQENERSGVDGYRTANARHILATHLEEMGRYSDALPLRQTQFDLFTVNKGPKHPETLVAKMWLALALMGVGDSLEARRLLLETRDAYLEKDGLDSENASRANHFLAEVQGRLDNDSDDY